MTEPMLPGSPVPRAKITVMSLQAALLVTSLAVLEPLLGKPGKEDWADRLVGRLGLGTAMALAASIREMVLEKNMLICY